LIRALTRAVFWRQDVAQHGPDAGAGEDRVECGGEVRAAVADHELDSLPAVAVREREQLLAAAWLTSLRSPRTRRAYSGDLRAWLSWLAERGVSRNSAALMLYGRIRPMGSWRTWGRCRRAGPAGCSLPPPPDQPLPGGDVKGALRASLRDP
jgi:hypothetical protein